MKTEECPLPHFSHSSITIYATYTVYLILGAVNITQQSTCLETHPRYLMTWQHCSEGLVVPLANDLTSTPKRCYVEQAALMPFPVYKQERA
jgi:hypothetical protein